MESIKNHPCCKYVNQYYFDHYKNYDLDKYYCKYLDILVNETK